MPLTKFQKQVFEVIRKNRTPESFVYGAIALHHGKDSPRFSQDIDLGHTVAESVAKSADSDAEGLEEQGFRIRWILRQPTFQRAQVSRDEESVILEWVADSAFRFFPIEPDPELGYRLHRFDAATNKILALAGRAEPRDYVDAMHLHQGYLSLGTLAWAAAGKDEGLNPPLILEMAERFAHYRQVDIDSLDLTVPLDIKTLSEGWRQALTEARALVDALPYTELGAAYLDVNGKPAEATIDHAKRSSLQTHFGSVGGAWPRLGR